MEQGNRLDSTPVSAAQADRDDTGTDRALDTAVTALLTRPAPEAPDRRTLIAYASWLAMERTHVCKELYPHLGWKAANFIAGDNAGFDFHRRDTPPASTRAASVLALVGCDWSQDRDMRIGDSGESFPDAEAYPHPDAHLIDLEKEYLSAQANYVSTYARETEARGEFARREEPYHEADQGLLLHSGPRAVHWHGGYLRRVLADRFAVASAFDAAVINNLRRDQLEALLQPVEARDARREALAMELRLDELEAESESALDVREDLAKKIYRLPARSLDGLALKARVLKINEPDLWERPSLKASVPAEWHELALTEIADGVEHLIAIGGRTGPASPGTHGAHLDAPLIALESELEIADARFRAAEEDYEERCAAACAALPGRPAALVFRETDHPFGLRRMHGHPDTMEGSLVVLDDIEWMSRRPLTREIKRPVRPGERAWHDFPGHVLDVVPWPEAQARANEILAAWNAWVAAQRALDEAHGLLDAEARCLAADEELKSVLNRIAALPARTAEGMCVKLRAFQDAVPHMKGANWGEMLLRSLMLDAGVSISELEA